MKSEQNNSKRVLEIDIVVPVYNCINQLPNTVEKLNLFENLTNQWLKVQYIFVNDGSTDASKDSYLECLLKLKSSSEFKYIFSASNQGKGSAIRQGLRIAKADRVGYLDADLSIEIADLEAMLKFFETITAGFLVSRRHNEFQYLYKSNTRSFMHILVKIICRIFFGIKINDVMSGAKFFFMDSYKEVESKLFVNRFCFDIQLISLIVEKKIPIFEFDIRWKHNSKTTVRPIVDGLQCAIDVIKIYLAKT